MTGMPRWPITVSWLSCLNGPPLLSTEHQRTHEATFAPIQIMPMFSDTKVFCRIVDENRRL